MRGAFYLENAPTIKPLASNLSIYRRWEIFLIGCVGRVLLKQRSIFFFSPSLLGASSETAISLNNALRNYVNGFVTSIAKI
jgi:hypothetical protein